VNPKIDGALSEDKFIPSLQRIGSSLNEVSFEQNRASSSSSHTLQIVLKSSDVH